jgi:hypothetical protein
LLQIQDDIHNDIYSGSAFDSTCQDYEGRFGENYIPELTLGGLCTNYKIILRLRNERNFGARRIQSELIRLHEYKLSYQLFTRH